MRTHEVKLLEGKVACPYARPGLVDVETCYRCPHLRAFHDEESGTRVVCAASLLTFPRVPKTIRAPQRRTTLDRH